MDPIKIKEERDLVKLNKINEGYSTLNKQMDAMSKDILKLTKRDRSQHKETLEPKNVKFNFE